MKLKSHNYQKNLTLLNRNSSPQTRINLNKFYNYQKAGIIVNPELCGSYGKTSHMADIGHFQK